MEGHLMEVGSEFVRKRGNRWQMGIHYRADANDKWHLKSKTCDAKTKREAKECLRQWHTIFEAKNSDTVAIHVADYVDKYIDLKEASHAIQPNTVEGYHYAAIYIRKAFASTPLNSLTAKDVQKWEASILASGKSVETVMKAHRLLKSAMTYAVEVDDIRKNPMAAVKPPKMVHRRPNSLDTATRKRLMESLDMMGNSPVTIAAWIALCGGLREGEVCGLKWDDVDMKDGTLWVRRSIAHTRGGTYVKEPKTGRIRDVPITATLMSHLKAWRECSTSTYVIGQGADYHNSAMLGKEWRIISRTLNLIGTEGRRCTFHDLRHTFATAAIAAGVDVKTVSSILGHANAAMTLNVYASADPDAKKRAADIIEQAI
jgi:integrase